MNREQLIAAGINYDEGLHRFANKEALYEKYLGKFVDDNTFSQLKGQLDAKDYEGAFRTAHDLKGLSSNLSVNDFYHAVCDLVEELRDGNPGPDIEKLYNLTEEKYNKACDAIRSQG